MNKTTLPPYLKPGNTIGITCPAGALSLETIEDMCKQLVSWGFEIRVGKTIGTSFHKFSASDDERLAELQEMLEDDGIDAILFGRGGYGLVRIIDQIDFTKFIQKPKWLLGYSDITCLLSHIYTQFGISGIHAHMSGGYHPSEWDRLSTQSIFDTLTGKPTKYDLPSHSMNREGEAIGSMVGGNLALLSDLIATPSDIDTKGTILFIEDIGEYVYNIDRMMWQLKRAGKLSHLKALLVGGFVNSLDNEIAFGMTEYEIVWEKVKEFDYPVFFDVPIGHQPRNVALKIGVGYQIKENTLFEISNLM
ncbi:MAG: LD-carboxypeptidase [Bacteroidetes bacterium]|nr:LD-carboxypeptidase [Bacteroidota bacterium]MBP6314280.1 LD-carboxypeptidase [Chitinophagaceae bacterium]